MRIAMSKEDEAIEAMVKVNRIYRDYEPEPTDKGAARQMLYIALRILKAPEEEEDNA